MVINKILIANRGEIAVRIIRTVREMGIASVAVYSDADRDALHVRLADEAYRLGPAPPSQSYLDAEKLIECAKRSRADGIHPDYGFFAESAEFARSVIAAGITWIGPHPTAIDAMGDKLRARSVMRDAGVPVVPGGMEAIADVAAAREAAERYGLGFDYLEKFKKEVEAVTPADVQAMAKKYIDPKALTIVAVGAIDKDGKPLGKKEK